MRQIFRIAKTELARLFYSPVAWLILIVFTCQVGIDFMHIFEEIYRIKVRGRTISFSLTAGMLLGTNGLYEQIQHTLYLYFPLLTMGLMSQEKSSGSIKLLYSSPITSAQIIFGKYFATVIYSLILLCILAFPIFSIYLYVDNVDHLLPLAGLLGLFLLMCTYMAIGLFMSCMTSYQVVAAITTLTLLTVLNFIGTIGQSITFIREITYWLSISGRASEMVGGLICSDDVIYFATVISLFLTFSIFKINSEKEYYSVQKNIIRYGTLFGIVLLVGMVSSSPKFMSFFDTTRTKARTLALASQEIMNELDGPLTITTYCNILDPDFDIGAPKNIKKDQELFKKYVRFKPETKLEYKYYYAPTVDKTVYSRFPEKNEKEIAKLIAAKKRISFDDIIPLEDIDKTINLKSEEYRFVRLIERGSGERSFLRIYDDMFRQPNETEISVAMKKLLQEPVVVGYIIGHGERSIERKGDGDYSIFASSLSFRHSMINQGFDMHRIELDAIDSIPSFIKIILIADSRLMFTTSEMDVLQKYIDNGGNMLIMSDVYRQENMNHLLSQFGVKICNGMLIQPSDIHSADLITAFPTDVSTSFSTLFKNMKQNPRLCITMPSAVALESSSVSDYQHLPLLKTNAQMAWLDSHNINLLDSLPTKPSEILDTSYTTAIALTRNVNNLEQRIIVMGDADCFSNGELNMQQRAGIVPRNYALINTIFRWLSKGEFPIALNRPSNIDVDFEVNASNITLLKGVYIWGLPILFMILGCCCLISRRKY